VDILIRAGSTMIMIELTVIMWEHNHICKFLVSMLERVLCAFDCIGEALVQSNLQLAMLIWECSFVVELILVDDKVIICNQSITLSVKD
jgi:hypothetical protein